MIANIELGRAYNQKELYTAIGISKPTFSNHRECILEELNDCYDYEITKTKTGRISKIYFIKKYEDYEYSSHHANTVKKDKFYKWALPDVIKTYPLNTPKNMARQMWGNKKYSQIKELSASCKSAQRDVRKRTYLWYGKDQNDLPTFKGSKKRLGRVVGSKWAFLDKVRNVYEPLTEEQEQELKQLFFKTHHNDTVWEQYTKAYSDCECQSISEQQKKNKISDITDNSFMAACSAFAEKYVRWPIPVKVYEIYQDDI